MLEPPEYARDARDSQTQSGDRLLLVGGRRNVRGLSRALAHKPWTRLPIVGVIGPSGRNRQLVVHPASEPVPILGRLDRLSELVNRSGATDLVVALQEGQAGRIRSQLDGLTRAGSGVRVHWVDGSGSGFPTSSTGRVSPTPGLPLSLRLQRMAKRAVDMAASALGLLVLSPLLLGVAILILVRTGWPIFYTQERVGQGGRRFKIIKFRSMRLDAEDSTGPVWAENHDRRCTGIGEWLRRTNIDELPQLLNVLKGDMSLVGPRPERPCFVEQFQAEMQDYELRHAVPCGMTGWAQVHGWRGRTSLRKRLQYDLDYIGRWTFWLDLRVLLMTVEHVLHGRTQWADRRLAPRADAPAETGTPASA